MSAPVRVDATGNREGHAVKQNVLPHRRYPFDGAHIHNTFQRNSGTTMTIAGRFSSLPLNHPKIVMVREGGPPTTLQRWCNEKEVVGGPPSQTMTRVG